MIKKTKLLHRAILFLAPVFAILVFLALNFKFQASPAKVLAQGGGIANGDFANGLTGWTKERETLHISTAADPDDSQNPVALLGDPTFTCTEVPIGNSYLTQNAFVPASASGQIAKVKFRYRINSYDRNINLGDEYDRFDFLINDEVKFKDANRGDFVNNCDHPIYDLGWKIGEYVFQTQELNFNVKIGFKLYNRQDNIYNTFVYLDDVRLEGVEPPATPTPIPTLTPIPTPTPACRRETANIINSDNSINADDVNEVLSDSNWGKSPPQNARADINSDRTVNSFDYECVHRWFGM